LLALDESTPTSGAGIASVLGLRRAADAAASPADVRRRGGTAQRVLVCKSRLPLHGSQGRSPWGRSGGGVRGRGAGEARPASPGVRRLGPNAGPGRGSSGLVARVE